MFEDLFDNLSDLLFYDSPEWVIVMGIITAVILAIIMCNVSFQKKEPDSQFGSFIRRLVNFDFFIIDKILKVMYIASTCMCIGYGFWMLFAVDDRSDDWMGGTGLLLMIVGPIAIRLFYELFMLLFTLVNKVISIDSKIKLPLNDITAASSFKPSANGSDKYCKNCGKKIYADATICPWCGEQN